MKAFDFLRVAVKRAGLFSLAMLALASAQEGMQFGAAGWMQFSVVGNSSDNVGEASYTGKNVFGSGAQITLKNQVSDRLDIAAGLGVAMGNTLARNNVLFGGYSPNNVSPFVSEANFTYAFWNEASSKLYVRGGLFSYIYNPDVKNLGLYLLRGPVYPGYVLSGFETKHVSPTANIAGLQIHHQMGRFSQDFLITSEMEFYPFFDLSPAYVAKFQAHSGLQVGAGVNFYHLIPVDDKLTNSKSWPYEADGDTTYFSYAGIKTTAFASLDPKAFIGPGPFGPEDLKLYGEISLIGLGNEPAHEEVYGDYGSRMPVMVGFNLPVFNALDHLSLEVEWYGARFVDDLEGYKNTADISAPTPIPYGFSPGENVKRDNWKWSLHGARNLGSHVRASFQVANDHWRPGVYSGDGDNNPARRQAILNTPKDWYSSLKLAYFF